MLSLTHLHSSRPPLRPGYRPSHSASSQLRSNLSNALQRGCSQAHALYGPLIPIPAASQPPSRDGAPQLVRCSKRTLSALLRRSPALRASLGDAARRTAADRAPRSSASAACPAHTE